MAAILLLLGLAGIHDGNVLVGGTRSTPGTPIYGEEALTIAVAYVGASSLLILWLCRFRPWFARAIGAALIGNVIEVR